MIDATVVSLLQNSLLDHAQSGVSQITGYAQNLIYLLTIIEIGLLGLLWTIHQDSMWGELIFKIIKIGLIFFIVSNAPYLLKLITQSFAQISSDIGAQSQTATYVKNPGKLWAFVYDSSIKLLKQAAQHDAGSSLGLIQILLSFGIILSMTMMIVQIIFQLAAFYLVSIFSLLFLPLGVLNVGQPFIGNSITQVLRAGVRVLVVLLVVSIAITIWSSFGLDNPDSTIQLKINSSLGLFISAFVFAYLATKLPNIVAQAVGEFETKKAPQVTVQGSSQELMPMASSSMSGSMVNMGQSANMGSVNMGQAGAMGSVQAASMITSGGGTATASSGSSSGSSSSPSARGKQGKSSQLGKASTVQRSISDETVKQIKRTVTDAMKEKGQ